MSRRTIWRCDSCGKEVEAYEPPGWFKGLYNVRSLRGLEETNIHADLCSIKCERRWLIAHLRQSIKEEQKENQQ